MDVPPPLDVETYIEYVTKAFGKLDLPYSEYTDEFILHRWDDNKWRAEIGNWIYCVPLGEAEGMFQGEGATAFDAVEDLLNKLVERLENDKQN